MECLGWGGRNAASVVDLAGVLGAGAVGVDVAPEEACIALCTAMRKGSSFIDAARLLDTLTS